MTPHDRNKRRVLIVKRWAAYRTGRAQREIWRKRKGALIEDPDDEVVGDDLELPDSLLG